MKTIPAAKFKAQCLAVMDQVQATREPVLLTKKGKPVAKLVPLDTEENPLAVFHFPGIVTVGDVISPAFAEDEWESLA